MLPWFGWKRHYLILYELSHLSHVCEDADLRKFVIFEHFFNSIFSTLLKISVNASNTVHSVSFFKAPPTECLCI